MKGTRWCRATQVIVKALPCMLNKLGSLRRVLKRLDREGQESMSRSKEITQEREWECQTQTLPDYQKAWCPGSSPSEWQAEPGIRL